MENPTRPGRTLCFLIECFLAGNLVIAGFWWWLMPGGFPIHHSRFWLNSVTPVVAFTAAAVGLAAVLRQNWRLARAVLVSFAAGWIAIAIAGRVLFPVSLSRAWFLALAAAGVGAGGFWMLRRHAKLNAGYFLGAPFAAAVVGAFIVWAEIPPVPTTNPIDERSERFGKNKRNDSLESMVRISGSAQFYPTTADFSMKAGSVTIRCAPLLSFDRISPDGFWSLLARMSMKNRNLMQGLTSPDEFKYEYDDGATIKFSASSPAGEVELTANSVLARDTFSHLNSFCTLDISGHKDLSLTFSPCELSPIEVLPSDYPVGRPARFAYLDAHGKFCVVEARSGEKGPFRELAFGTLRSGESLTITVRDAGLPIASVSITDWASQLSTAISPTAGWGVPANAIEFRRHDEPASAPATIWISLAGTSIGRGWDTVGHRAGVYRNRLEFRDLTAADKNSADE